MTRTLGRWVKCLRKCDGCKRLYLHHDDIDCCTFQRILLLRQDIHVSEKEHIILKGDEIRKKKSQRHTLVPKATCLYFGTL